MRQSVLLLASLLLPIHATRSDAPTHYHARTVGIEGTWRLISYEVNGEKEKPTTDVQEVMTFYRGTFTSTFRNGYTWRGNYRIDTTRSPAHLDEIATHGDFRGQPLNCIYRIDFDILRVANMALPNKPRPQSFDARGVHVETYQRVE